MAAKTFFITGTDTGVGKTVFTAAFAAHLHGKGLRVAALKPIASGGRGDARLLRAAVANTLTLDEINPWHFKQPVAPVIAAREEGRGVRLENVVAHVRGFTVSHDVVVVEAAGGLLSPMGGMSSLAGTTCQPSGANLASGGRAGARPYREGFDCRDLLSALRAVPVVVCPDRVGAVNQARLVWEALPRAQRNQAWLVLAEQGRAQPVMTGNQEMLSAFISAERTVRMPWLEAAKRKGKVPVAFRKAMEQLSEE